jgi:hypothetical protein
MASKQISMPSFTGGRPGRRSTAGLRSVPGAKLAPTMFPMGSTSSRRKGTYSPNGTRWFFT